MCIESIEMINTVLTVLLLCKNTEARVPGYEIHQSLSQYCNICKNRNSQHVSTGLSLPKRGQLGIVASGRAAGRQARKSQSKAARLMTIIIMFLTAYILHFPEDVHFLS